MTPEVQSLGSSVLSIAPPIDGASKALAESLVAGPALVGSNKILVHRKAILSVMGQNRALTERNKMLQAGIDQAAQDNAAISTYLEVALDLLREAKGWDHRETGLALSAEMVRRGEAHEGS